MKGGGQDFKFLVFWISFVARTYKRKFEMDSPTAKTSDLLT